MDWSTALGRQPESWDALTSMKKYTYHAGHTLTDQDITYLSVFTGLMNACIGELIEKLELAEAALAERDRMLHFCIERIALTPERWNGWTTNEVLADLRNRADEGSEDG